MTWTPTAAMATSSLFSISSISPTSTSSLPRLLKSPVTFLFLHRSKAMMLKHSFTHRLRGSNFYSRVSCSSRLEGSDNEPEKSRPIKDYNANIWGNYFQSCTSGGNEEIYAEEHQVLVEKVKKELLSMDEKRRLKFIDMIERLGVAYHFSDEIEESLEEVYHSYNKNGDHEEDDLNHVSLRFRILRQHGFYVTSDSFIKFADENGDFLDSLVADPAGILSLYEASHVRVYGEDLLERALSLTTCHLTSMKMHPNNPLIGEVNHALSRPLQKSLVRLEARIQIALYENDPSHSEALLKFSKLELNIAQSSYKKELQEVTRWWESLCHSENFSFARDRLVENYFLTTVVLFEPKYSLSRIIVAKASFWMTIVDDLYDSYGTSGELKVFTDAIQRWDKSYTQKLPSYMKVVYEMMLDDFNQFKIDLIEAGKPNYVQYGIEEVKVFSRSSLKAVKCREAINGPTYEEYMRHGSVAIGAKLMAAITMMTMGEEVEEEDFECLSLFPNVVRDTSIISRLLNDIAGYETDKNEGGVSSVFCYMKQYGVSKEEACTEITRQIEGAWVDINEEMCLYPTTRLRKLLNTILLRMAQVSHTIYDGEDGFRMVKKGMKDYITRTFVDPITL